MHSDAVSELAQRVGPDVVLTPDAQTIQRHLQDFGVPAGSTAVILALAYPRDTREVSAILKFCNERRIGVQPQGGMTGKAGGGVPVGPCVVVSLERMRAIKELDVAVGTRDGTGSGARSGGGAGSGFGSQLTAFEVMWPDFYELGTSGLGRRPPLARGAGAYVLLETMGQDSEADQQRYESVIGDALEAGIISDAIVAKSSREATELWSVRDSPGESQRTQHWPQLGFEVSVPTGEI